MIRAKIYSILINLTVLGFLMLPMPSHAAYTVVLIEDGGNVVATGSGSLNLDDAELPSPTTITSAVVTPKDSVIFVGQTSSIATKLVTLPNFIAPASLGAGSFTDGSIGSGGIVGAAEPIIAVPPDYVSRQPLPATTTWNGATFASLGITPGTYTWSWGTGPNADSFTLQVGPIAVPALGGYAMLGLASLLAMAGMAYARMNLDRL